MPGKHLACSDQFLCVQEFVEKKSYEELLFLIRRVEKRSWSLDELVEERSWS